jgi:hypothetical protein
MIFGIEKKEVVMHGSLKMNGRNHAQNCCEEIYSPTGINLPSMRAGFQRPLQSKGYPVIYLLTKLCDPGRGWIRCQSHLYSVWVLLLTGSVQEKNLSHNKIDGYSVLSQEIQTTKALLIVARWDRHRPHHSLILVGTEVYWFMIQNDKNRIMRSYAHITLYVRRVYRFG